MKTTEARKLYIRCTTDHKRAFILWHVDPLLGNDHETSNYTTAVAK
jgi:hypothetical protein